jgi:hypothetical protein
VGKSVCSLPRRVAIRAKTLPALPNRSDIAILAFNVDDDPKAMTTALQELRVSIPSIAARDFAYSIVPAVALPANWISLPERQRCSWVTTTHTKRGSKALPLRLRRPPESEQK